MPLLSGATDGALAAKIEMSNAVLDAQHIGRSLYGLRCCADSPAVDRVLLALAAKIENSKAVLDAQHIGCSLNGLSSGVSLIESYTKE